jgi:hypothetical protein
LDEAAGRIDQEHARVDAIERIAKRCRFGFFYCNIAQKCGGPALFAKFVFAFGFVY